MMTRSYAPIVPMCAGGAILTVVAIKIWRDGRIEYRSGRVTTRAEKPVRFFLTVVITIIIAIAFFAAAILVWSEGGALSR